MNAVTYKNRNTFIDVLAWLCIVYGAYAVYTSFGQLILSVWFFSAPELSGFLVMVWAMSIVFAAASLWCGMGLRKRSRSALTTLIVFLWLYVLWSIGLTVWSFVTHFLWSSIADTAYPEMATVMEASSRSTLAYMIFSATKAVLEFAVVIWLVGQLSSPFIRDEFAG